MRPVTAAQGWFFHWDKTPVHSAALVKVWFSAH
jgi:hypothetical protein